MTRRVLLCTAAILSILAGVFAWQGPVVAQGQTLVLEDF